jgi:hypothetical protein
VEINRTVSDFAATETWDKGFTQSVKQWTAEQNWDSRATSVGIDVNHAGLLNIRWIQNHVPGDGVVGNGYTVQLQQASDNLNV